MVATGVGRMVSKIPWLFKYVLLAAHENGKRSEWDETYR